ncbi:MAG: BglG family transcription antiterminator [Clostridia bacterium]|nr:BglG family transcription antiterminator [Clostridia bacterium]
MLINKKVKSEGVFLIKKRQSEILRDIILEKEKVDYQYLIEKYDVSERTLRNDLNAIDDYLNKERIPSLNRSKVNGIRFVGDLLQKDRVLWEASNEDRQSYIMNQEERLDHILFFLLQQEIPISIQDIADDIGFSKNTIVEDIKKLDELLHDDRCRLVRKRKIGMHLEATEFHKRQLFVELVQKKSYLDKWQVENWEAVFDEKALEDKRHLIEGLQDRLKRVYTDTSIHTIAMVMQLSAVRYAMGHMVTLQPYQYETIKLSNEYKVLSQHLIDQPLAFLENDMEKAYISMYLLTNKIFKQESVNFFDDRVANLKAIIDRMIIIMEQDQQVELLTSEREKLARGLLLHLEPAVYRMRYGIGISNKLLGEIQLKFSQYYDAASKACMYLSQSLHVIVPDEEIGFIALHFGGVMEGYFSRQEINRDRSKAVLVCNAGMATVRILEARLKDEFEDLDIVGYYSYAGYQRQEELLGDVVVTTIAIEDERLPVVVVNPLLDDRDIEKLNQYFRKKRHIQEKKDIDLKAIMNVVEKYCTVISPAHLKKELKSIIDPQVERNDLTMYDLLSRDRVQLGVEVDSWEEALDIAARPLMEHGYITEAYPEAMKANNKAFKAYSVIRPYIAIPHAKPEDGVIDVGLSLVVLKKPIPFGNPKNDPVKFIFMLSNKDEISHLRALNIFMQMIRKQEHVDTLLSLKSYKALETWVRKFEEGLL